MENNKSVISIKIFESDDTPVAFIKEDKSLVIYYRMPGETIVATRDQLKRLVSKGNDFVFDSAVTNHHFSDFTFSTLNEKYKEKHNTLDDISIKLLQSTNMLTPDNYLTNAGLLFADNCINDESRIHCRKWSGFNRGDDLVIDHKEFQGNIIEIIDFGIKFIKNNSATGFIKQVGGRIDYLAYPTKAIEEALVNACAHRDMMQSGTQIDIDIFKDRLVITSPGEFIHRGNIQDYDLSEVSSKRRNKIICNVLHLVKLMEKSGSGFEKIIDAYKNFDVKYQPKAESTPSTFRMTLFDLTYDSNISSVNNEQDKSNVEDSLDNLTIQEKIILDYLVRNESIKRHDVDGLLDVKDSRSRAILRSLVKKNKIIKIGDKKDSKYILK